MKSKHAAQKPSGERKTMSVPAEKFRIISYISGKDNNPHDKEWFFRQFHTLEQNYGEIDEHETREYFDADAVVVFAQDPLTQEIVGRAAIEESVNDEQVGVFGFAYVTPSRRRQGVYTQMVYERIRIAKDLGYQKVVTYPAKDGNSKKVLEKIGFTEFDGDDENDLQYELTDCEVRTIYPSNTL